MRKKVATIKYGSEYRDLYDDGCIGRPKFGIEPSGEWKVVGARELNNFGRTIRFYSLSEIIAGKVPWKYKNGRQKSFIVDEDHGINRLWSNDHEVLPAVGG